MTVATWVQIIFRTNGMRAGVEVAVAANLVAGRAARNYKLVCLFVTTLSLTLTILRRMTG